MSEYVPTTDEVRDLYDYQYILGIEETSQTHGFDRWLAGVKAEAWDEGWIVGYNEGRHDEGEPYSNPYREEL